MAISGSHTSDVEPILTSGFRPSDNLMVEHKSLKSEEFDVEIVRWVDGLQPDFNKMIIHPVESGNFLEFRSKSNSNFSGKGTRIQNVININKQIQVQEGFLRKKENVILEISLSNQKSPLPQTIIIDVEDKEAQKIINLIDQAKTFNPAERWPALSFPVALEDGSISTIELLPSSPFFARGEKLLWSSVGTEGILKTHIVFLNALTNYRILQYDFKNHLANYATMGAIDDVVVTNQRRISESSGSGTYTGTRLGYTRTGFGNTRSKSTGITVGDVTFIHQGKAIASISQIKDPHGLSRLAKSARKQYILIEKAIKKSQTVNKKKEPAQVMCGKCGASNATGSNFCNSCGNALS